MSDSDVTLLERTWRTSGAGADEAALLAARRRAGAVSTEALRAAAYLGCAAAASVVGPVAAVEGGPEAWLRGLTDAAREADDGRDVQDASPLLGEVERLAGGQDEALREALTAARAALSAGRAPANDVVLRLVERVTSKALRVAFGAHQERLVTNLLALTQVPGERARRMDAVVLARASLAIARSLLAPPSADASKQLVRTRRELARAVEDDDFERVCERAFELAEGPLPHLLVEAAEARLRGEPTPWEGACDAVLDRLLEEVAGVETPAFVAAERAFERASAEVLAQPVPRRRREEEDEALLSLAATREVVGAELLPWLIGQRPPVVVEPPKTKPKRRRAPAHEPAGAEGILARVKGRPRALLERVLAGDLLRERLIAAAWLDDPAARKALEAGGADLREPDALLTDELAGRIHGRAAAAAVELALEMGEREAGAPLGAARAALDGLRAWVEGGDPGPLDSRSEAAQAESSVHSNERRFAAMSACRAAAIAATIPGRDRAGRKLYVSLTRDQAANARGFLLPEAERPDARTRRRALWADVCARLLPWALA